MWHEQTWLVPSCCAGGCTCSELIGWGQVQNMPTHWHRGWGVMLSVLSHGKREKVPDPTRQSVENVKLEIWMFHHSSEGPCNYCLSHFYIYAFFILYIFDLIWFDMVYYVNSLTSSGCITLKTKMRQRKSVKIKGIRGDSWEKRAGLLKGCPCWVGRFLQGSDDQSAELD